MLTISLIAGLICYAVLWTVIILSIAKQSYSKRREMIVFILAGLFLLLIIPPLVVM